MPELPASLHLLMVHNSSKAASRVKIEECVLS